LFHELTKKAIIAAIDNSSSINHNLFEAQQARRILDRLVGYQISPLLWEKVRRGLSAGRVQSVAVRMICEREEEINIFQSEEYWSVTVNLSGVKPPPFDAALEKIDNEKCKIGGEEQVKVFDEAYANEPKDDCRFFWSMGLFDAKYCFQQNVVVEYILEIHDAHLRGNAHTDPPSVKKLFAERFKLAGLDLHLLQKMDYGTDLFSNIYVSFTEQATKTAQQLDQALPIGRFVITSGAGILTAYDYLRDKKGNMLFQLLPAVRLMNFLRGKDCNHLYFPLVITNLIFILKRFNPA